MKNTKKHEKLCSNNNHVELETPKKCKTILNKGTAEMQRSVWKYIKVFTFK